VQSLTGNFSSEKIDLYQWDHCREHRVSFAFFIDHLTIIMLMIVTGVGFLIHVYSVGYMHDDEGYGKFFSYLNLFIFFMLILVDGSKLCDDVHWMGRSGVVFLPADRVLVEETAIIHGCKQSFYHEPQLETSVSSSAYS